MGKRKSSSSGVQSKGERRNVAPRNSRTQWSDLDQHLHKVAAWRVGKRVLLTIPNPNAAETARPFVRVTADQVWGSAQASYRMK